jgi:hypothetical protein
MPAINYHLFKRSNGFWYILYTLDGKVRWKSTKATSKIETLQKLQEFQPKAANKQEQKSLATFTQDFLSFAYATYARATCDIYLCMHQTFLDKIS